jgi:hypothetical protein
VALAGPGPLLLKAFLLALLFPPPAEKINFSEINFWSNEGYIVVFRTPLRSGINAFDVVGTYFLSVWKKEIWVIYLTQDSIFEAKCYPK